MGGVQEAEFLRDLIDAFAFLLEPQTFADSQALVLEMRHRAPANAKVAVQLLASHARTEGEAVRSIPGRSGALLPIRDLIQTTTHTIPIPLSCYSDVLLLCNCLHEGPI